MGASVRKKEQRRIEFKEMQIFQQNMWCEERNKVRESEKLKTKKTQGNTECSWRALI